MLKDGLKSKLEKDFINGKYDVSLTSLIVLKIISSLGKFTYEKIHLRDNNEIVIKNMITSSFFI